MASELEFITQCLDYILATQREGADTPDHQKAKSALLACMDRVCATRQQLSTPLRQALAALLRAFHAFEVLVEGHRGMVAEGKPACKVADSSMERHSRKPACNAVEVHYHFMEAMRLIIEAARILKDSNKEGAEQIWLRLTHEAFKLQGQAGNLDLMDPASAGALEAWYNARKGKKLAKFKASQPTASALACFSSNRLSAPPPSSPAPGSLLPTTSGAPAATSSPQSDQQELTQPLLFGHTSRSMD